MKLRCIWVSARMEHSGKEFICSRQICISIQIIIMPKTLTISVNINCKEKAFETIALSLKKKMKLSPFLHFGGVEKLQNQEKLIKNQKV